jgi:5-methyltetrahydrofolate--homocysteine methyltransferase
VSGIYLHHPEARYFSVGRIGRDQVEAYAARQGRSLPEVERWVRPNLAYEPDERADAAPQEEGILPAAAK